MSRAGFPIDAVLGEIQASMQTHTRLVLEAPPGAGKTTQVPLALREAAWLQGRQLVVLEPRRVAARAAADFMARQLGEPVGQTVGYRIRFDSKVSAQTRIVVVTEGIVTRMLQEDPLLEGVGGLLFDEFHERHLASDLSLALACEVQASLRPDLRIVVMSATLDGERLAAHLDAPRLSSAGRSFPVTVAHVAARREASLQIRVAQAVEHALASHPGDVLVFLPGRREINQVQAVLAARLPQDIPVLPLHGELSVEQQVRVLNPATNAERRVVLATNVAESSVTLPGVRVVVDSGLAREPRFDPNSGFSRLEVVTIAQASADQRAGRAGRVAPGWAYRLWPQSQRLEPQRRAEIVHGELSSLALELAAWGSDDLPFVDRPPPGALAAGRELLHQLGALAATATDQRPTLTTLGRQMLALGTHPRLAAMLQAAHRPPVRALACDIAALLEARDPLRSRSDALAERWQALAAWRTGQRAIAASGSALATIDAVARQWRRRLQVPVAPPDEAPAHQLGNLLLHAYPDRIGHPHRSDPYRYQLANGRMVRLAEDSTLLAQPWIVVTELQHAPGRDAWVVRGAPVDEAHLRAAFAHRFVTQDVVRWDPDRRALLAQREQRFDGIVLDARPAGQVDPRHAAQALSDAVADLGLDVLPWTDDLRQWRVRLRSLRAWAPELELPDLSDATLLAERERWLQPAFAGKTRLDGLGEMELTHALQQHIDWTARQHLDSWAPSRILVPSGLQRRIEYGYDAVNDLPLAPILAVKLQELFGLADTPRIAHGRIGLTLHLLSPAGRPLQVTQDLSGFWERTYPEVRKQMKGRYPKHPWPDDPWHAVATHRAKSRPD